MTGERIKYYTNGDGPKPATPIKAYRIADPVRVLLYNHRCTIISVDPFTDVLTYPDGTTREQLYPVTTDVRYRVKLPDGIEIREIDRRHGMKDLILLSLVIDAHSTDEIEEIIAELERQKRGLTVEQARLEYKQQVLERPKRVYE